MNSANARRTTNIAFPQFFNIFYSAHPVPFDFITFCYFFNLQLYPDAIWANTRMTAIGNDAAVKFTRQLFPSVYYLDGERFLTLGGGIKKGNTANNLTTEQIPFSTFSS